MILQDVPDLPSLYMFVCASARVNAAFDFDPAPILDKVIDRSIPHFKHLTCMIAIIGSLNIQTGPDVQSLRPSFTSLVVKFSSLPQDVLTTALPSYAFAAHTQNWQQNFIFSKLIKLPKAKAYLVVHLVEVQGPNFNSTCNIFYGEMLSLTKNQLFANNSVLNRKETAARVYSNHHTKLE
jgi:hypothetical protein